MATKKDFYALMRGENPTWMGAPWQCFGDGKGNHLAIDPVTIHCGQGGPGQALFTNDLGLTFQCPEGQPAPTEYITEETKLIKDVTCWQDFVKFPDPKQYDWTISDQIAAGIDRDKHIFMYPSFIGFFEYTHAAMGFEDALCNYLEEPEAMYDLIGAYCDWRIECAKVIIDHWHPEMIHSHDDWGSKTAMFLPPQVWREIIKPHYARFYKFLHENGVLVQHHNDGYSANIVQDMVEIGIDIWQGTLPTNDIPKVIEETEGNLCILGGVAVDGFDVPNGDPEKIRAEAKRAIYEYGPCGSFIPCATCINPIFPENQKVLDEALNEFGAQFMREHYGVEPTL